LRHVLWETAESVTVLCPQNSPQLSAPLWGKKKKESLSRFSYSCHLLVTDFRILL
jgi:hypothetical protein